MWPDNETEKDLIGFKVHADLIGQVVMDEKMLPITLGIFGDWGGGKTSIMKMLEKDLSPNAWPEGSPEKEAREKIVVIYLNTWLFEGYDDAKTALLTALLLQLGEHKRFGPKVRDGIASLLKSLDLKKALKLGFNKIAIPLGTALATGGVDSAAQFMSTAAGLFCLSSEQDDDETKDSKESEDTESIDWNGLIKKAKGQKEPLAIRTFRARFGKMLKDSDIKSLVVVIDDLDRCTPERIIESLEAIKLFLSVERTAYIIGADQRIVQHAIRTHYSRQGVDVNSEDTSQLVKDYLEKLIQVPYRIPRLSASEIETYMVLLFCQHHLNSVDADKCIKACEDLRKTDRYSTFGYAAVRHALGDIELERNLAEAINFCRNSAPLITDCLKGNPRQVKRFLNAVQLRKGLARAANLTLLDDVLIKLMILEYTHEDLFLILFEWQAKQKGYPEQIKQFEKSIGKDDKPSSEVDDKNLSSKWDTGQIIQWLRLEPKLADIDLRDYFWVARDRLNATMTGITMVPPIVRSVFTGLLKAPNINSLIPDISKFSPDELNALLGLLEQQISRRPKEKRGYDILRILGEHDIPGALGQLSNILLNRPLDDVNAAVGLDIVNLLQSKPSLKDILEPIITRLKKSNSRVGKAVNTGSSLRVN